MSRPKLPSCVQPWWTEPKEPEMTPSDSDAHEFQCEACPRAFSSAPALALHERRWHGSGEREVCGAVIARMNGDDVLTCDQQRGHDGAHYVKIGAFGGAREDEVLLSRPLAQRILAALESVVGDSRGLDWKALAAELRALVTK